MSTAGILPIFGKASNQQLDQNAPKKGCEEDIDGRKPKNMPEPTLRGAL